ncbi:MAG: aspartyl-tRNA(Asn)/glutamyl-tRNA(Gln) amidotransferase subunit C [Rickettsiales bacterium]|jgi:aspartyl-tRNA(Asn)/glutamyl-tRNA(Gln) amidotransferase subunit C
MSDINIKKIAKLSKIKILQEEEEDLSIQLKKIIDWVDTLSDVDTDNVEILNNVHSNNLTLFEDVVQSNEDSEQLMANATDNKYDYYTVPKMIK